MPRILATTILAAALVSPAVAAQVLYATAAIPNRIDGFCLGTNGGIDVQPVFQQDTVENPRRLYIPPKPDGTPGDVLYVAGKHRVQSYQIKTNGGLESIGQTNDLHNANPYDLAVDRARTHIYIPNRSAGRIEAYPLNPAGGMIGGNMTSCARLPADVNLQDLKTSDLPGFEVLYSTSSTANFSTGKRGRVDVFQLTDGELPDLYDNDVDPEGALRCGNPDATTTTTSTSTSSTSLTTLTTTVTTTTTSTTVDTRNTPTLSTRKKLRGPGPFVLSGEFLYVYDLFNRRIIEFELVGGLFTDDKQPRVAASNEVGRFFDLIGVLQPGVGQTLLGAADNLGRVRAFGLKSDSGLPTLVPKEPQRQTNQIIDSTPVRIRVGTTDSGDMVLYVPGGEANKIHAYRIDGRLYPEAKAFSVTTKRKGTFPNDAAVAQIAGSCP